MYDFIDDLPCNKKIPGLTTPTQIFSLLVIKYEMMPSKASALEKVMVNTDGHKTTCRIMHVKNKILIIMFIATPILAKTKKSN
jgi:hypothetical protein